MASDDSAGYWECEVEVKVNVTYRLPLNETPSPKHDFRYVKPVENAVGNVKGTTRFSPASTRLLRFEEIKVEKEKD